METVFASQSGCVRNTTETVRSQHPAAAVQLHHGDTLHAPAGTPSGLGGQIGELAAALNTIGWNHNQVPPEERIPLSEQEPATAAAASPGLGGQIGELAAALNTIGWNHNQVPPDERIPLSERT